MGVWMDFHYKLFGKFRERRMRQFLAIMRPDNEPLLDVGGTEHTWAIDAHGYGNFPVVMANVYFHYADSGNPRFSRVQANGCDLPFSPHSFAIIYSNSVIEHVGDRAAQRKFADELRRVGRKLWVQTPARCFPIEPHFLAPFIHWLPMSWQRALVRFTPKGIAEPAAVQGILKCTRLLNRREMEECFPDCEILVERVLGWPKSYIAVRRTDPAESHA